MPTFRWTTVGQFRQRLRELFQSSTGLRACKLAKYIRSLNLTDNQLKSLFNINNAQLAALKTKLQNMEAKYDDTTAQEGQ